MPKLKEDPLKKGYTCQYCGKSLPTKQGLSGHIQFMHDKKYVKEPELTYSPEIIQDLKHAEKQFGFSTIPSDDTLDIPKYWTEFKLLCQALKIELNQQDLKHYVIANLVQIHQNQRLKEKIINDLIGITGK